jgi:methionyl-tRNA formyltransferase
VTLRILFLGAGSLALPVFQSLCDSGVHQLVGLVTQPDRTGRGHHQHANPLKELAVARGLPVMQPDSIKTPESVELLIATRSDLFVVAAYGQMLSKAVLAIPRLGTINVHASLLPKYRGASPIHAAILNGDNDTGVTIIEIVQKLDAGPMLGLVSTSILAGETTGQLEQRLAEIAVPLTKKVIDEIDRGVVTRTVQNESLVTHVRKLSKTDGLVPWNRSAMEIDRHVRGMQPWPGSFSHLHQPEKPPLRLQILSVKVIETRAPSIDHVPGTVIAVGPHEIMVQCEAGSIGVQTVQPDGKRAMAMSDFLRGRKVSPGDTFA